jgi:hypothetical protein
MVFPLAAVGAAVSVGSALSGYMGARSASKKAKQAGKAASNVIYMEGEESARRLKREQEFAYGESTARAFASNLQMSGSTDYFLRDMYYEQRRELDWLNRETRARADAAYRGASTQASNLRNTATTNLMASLGSLAMRAGV